VPSSDLVPLYYLAGIGATISSGLWATRSYFQSQRTKWLAEGRKEANLAEKLDSNTAAASKNTAAIDRLTGELRDFASQTRDQLSNHDGRIRRLEDTFFLPGRQPGQRPAGKDT
jgi:hypothetical protein